MKIKVQLRIYRITGIFSIFSARSGGAREGIGGGGLLGGEGGEVRRQRGCEGDDLDRGRPWGSFGCGLGGGEVEAGLAFQLFFLLAALETGGFEGLREGHKEEADSVCDGGVVLGGDAAGLAVEVVGDGYGDVANESHGCASRRGIGCY